MLNTFIPCQYMAEPNAFGDICENLLSGPYVLFLETAAMLSNKSKTPNICSIQDIQSNIRTKFGSNWFSSVRENFWKKLIAKTMSKRGNNSNIVSQIKMEIWPQIDLLMLNTLCPTPFSIHHFMFILSSISCSLSEYSWNIAARTLNPNKQTS